MNSKTWTRIIAMTSLAALAIPAQVAAQDKQQHQHKFHHYQLVDVGTFGGPESYINPPFTFGSHNQINRRGVAVGGSGTSIPTTPTSDLFVCGGLDGIVPFVNHAFVWQEGNVTDLGALPGGDNCSVATSINERGEIVGTSENGLIDPAVGVTQIRAVLWKNGQVRDLGTLGGNGSAADAINSRGQVVGFAFNAIPDPLSYVYFGLAGSTAGTQTRAYLWENGAMQDLGTLGGPDAAALFVNERGQVAGLSYTNSTVNPVTGLPTIHPFVWTRENGMKDLGSLGGTLGSVNCSCSGFNNRGQLVGLSDLEGDQTAHPFLWDGQKLIDLFTNTIGATPNSANYITDGGEIVGNAGFPNGASDAYLWKNGVAIDLGALEGDCSSEAFAINSWTQVVGQSYPCSSNTQRAFLWENGSIVDLNTLMPPRSSLLLVWPMAINDREEIAGVGLPAGCDGFDPDAACGHAFLLIPCDENHPGIEGCDYSTVDASAATFVRPRLRPASGDMPFPARMHRNNRLRFPAFGHGN
jgi:probable HAF family extracellular repeat protein